jgi:hypothetical protein
MNNHGDCHSEESPRRETPEESGQILPMLSMNNSVGMTDLQV